MRAGAIAVLVAGSVLPTAARADEVRATLAWVRGRGAERCGDADALRAAVARRLGRDVFVAAAPVSVEATVTAGEPGGARWVAQVFVRGPGGALVGERELRSGDEGCDAVLDAVALVVAVSLDAEAALRPPSPAAATAPPPPPPPARCPPPRPRPAPSRGWELAYGARGLVSLGMQPGLGGGASVQFEARPPAGPRLVAGAWYWPATSAPVPEAMALGVARVELAGLSLGVCPLEARAGTFSAAGCVSTSVGQLVAVGSGFDYSRVADGFYWSLDPGVRARWAPRVFYAELALDAVVPLVRDTLSVDMLGDVFRPSLVGLRAAIGAGLHFE